MSKMVDIPYNQIAKPNQVNKYVDGDIGGEIIFITERHIISIMIRLDKNISNLITFMNNNK